MYALPAGNDGEMGVFEHPYMAVPANKTASRTHTPKNIQPA